MSIETEETVSGLLRRSVRLANGDIANYVTSGETGPAVVLLHGGLEGSSGTSDWRFMATFLGANGFRVYAPDRPGFDRSNGNLVEYLDSWPKTQVDFVKRFADVLCLDSFWLAGNSAGCIIAANFAVSNPDRLRGVALVSGLVGDVSDGLRIPQARDSLNQVMFTTRDRLDRLALPMIYLYGLQDLVVPVENGYLQEDALPNVQFFYPDGCGHEAQIDQPDMFNQVFLDFFREGRVSWETAQWAGVSRRREINPDLVAEPPEGFPPPVPEAYASIETLRVALRATLRPDPLDF